MSNEELEEIAMNLYEAMKSTAALNDLMIDRMTELQTRVKDCETAIVSLAAALHSQQAAIELAVLPKE